jgi:hypothetical protein
MFPTPGYQITGIGEIQQPGIGGVFANGARGLNDEGPSTDRSPQAAQSQTLITDGTHPDRDDLVMHAGVPTSYANLVQDECGVLYCLVEIVRCGDVQFFVDKMAYERQDFLHMRLGAPE